MRIVDICAIAVRAKAVGAKTAVDNTFLSPALQRPIALGADFVIHSTTKYLNGHSDVVGGVVITADRADLDELSAWANLTGVNGAPFDAYLTLRGLRTRLEGEKDRPIALIKSVRARLALLSSTRPRLSRDGFHRYPSSSGVRSQLTLQKSIMIEERGTCPLWQATARPGHSGS